MFENIFFKFPFYYFRQYFLSQTFISREILQSNFTVPLLLVLELSCLAWFYIAFKIISVCSLLIYSKFRITDCKNLNSFNTQNQKCCDSELRKRTFFVLQFCPRFCWLNRRIFSPYFGGTAGKSYRNSLH